jgi:hypothetical protein
MIAYEPATEERFGDVFPRPVSSSALDPRRRRRSFDNCSSPNLVAKGIAHDNEDVQG